MSKQQGNSLLDGFEVFEFHDKVIPKEIRQPIFLALNKKPRCYVNLSKEALSSLLNPEYVCVLYNRETNMVAIKASSKGDENSIHRGICCRNGRLMSIDLGKFIYEKINRTGGEEKRKIYGTFDATESCLLFKLM